MAVPGWGSPKRLTTPGFETVRSYRFIGAIHLDFPMDGIFRNRALAYIPAQFVCAPYIVVMLTFILMLYSGFYLYITNMTLSRYLSVGFMVLIAVQTASYTPLCWGTDLLLPEVSPVWAGNGCTAINAVFLLMACTIAYQPLSDVLFYEQDTPSDPYVYSD